MSLKKLVILDTKLGKRSGLRNKMRTADKFGDEIRQVIAAVALQRRSSQCAGQCECEEVQCILCKSSSKLEFRKREDHLRWRQ
jgi:hypothetical protein